MIPLTLHLKNFLSYGSEIQTINFGPYPLICLSGKNGHGKSALLDAITWALWGQARKISGSSKADEGLLRLGQTQMMVSLDFIFNGQTFRVRREFAHTYGKPYAALDFGIIDQATGQITSLTDKTIRATQEKIEEMIGLDFDSFINSAFLRQGQSNEFSKKSPKERKEILGTILGLNRFDRLRSLALEKARQANAKKEQMLALHDHVTQELAQLPELIAQIATHEQALEEITQQQTTIDAHIHDLAMKKKDLDQQHQHLELLTFKRTELQQQYDAALTKLRSVYAMWKEVHRKNLSMPDPRVIEKEKQAISQELEKQQLVQQKNLSLKEEYLTRKEQEQLLVKKLRDQYLTMVHEKKVALEHLHATQQSHERMHKQLAQQAQEFEQEKKIILEERSKLTSSHNVSALEHDITRHEKQFEKRKQYYHTYVTRGNWIKGELDGLIQKQKLSHAENDPSCPLCEQNLSATRKKFLKSKFAKQEEFLHHRFTRLKALITKLKELLIEQHAYITNQRKLYDEAQQNARRLQELEVHEQKIVQKHTLILQQQAELITALEQTTQKKPILEQEIATLIAREQDIYTTNDEYQKIHKELTHINKQVQELAYNPIYHQTIAEKRSVLEQQLAAHHQLVEATAQQQQRKEQIHDLVIQLKKVKTEQNSLTAQMEPLAILKHQLEQLKLQEQTLLTTLKEITSQKEHLLQQKGSLDRQKQHLIRKEQELGEHKKAILSCTQTAEEYQAIAHALGKDGIQALLIEDAIPEIEQEANQLLAKLTDNQAQIFIESLRDLKKGGTKETLDIKISDAVGIRPYELFSGGEAFRIDFSLRIAISKLLARRAGTSLQTLIIDEGFGSQDEDGLSHIMDAIYKIQDDFLKIIIVSHLPSMKDQFPVHFIVEKGAQGSTIRTIEQG